jgi:hypothetical protein
MVTPTPYEDKSWFSPQRELFQLMTAFRHGYKLRLS